MVGVVVLGVLSVIAIAGMWAIGIDNTKDVDYDEPCDFWMTDD